MPVVTGPFGECEGEPDQFRNSPAPRATRGYRARMNKWGWLAITMTAAAVACTGVVFSEPVPVGWLEGGSGLLGGGLALTVTFALSAVIGVLISRVPDSTDPVTRVGQVLALIGLLGGAVGCALLVLQAGIAQTWPFLYAVPTLFWAGILIIAAARFTRSRGPLTPAHSAPASMN